MRPSEAIAGRLDEVRAIIARYPVRNPRVFGSVARGEDDERSDLDLLVDPLEKATSLSWVAGRPAGSGLSLHDNPAAVG